jgi:uncharacterized RDD family membrane protein YckC
MADLAAPVSCHRCNMTGQQKLFCQGCGLYLLDATGTVERVTFTRRFFGTDLLEGLLIIVTLIVGWLIWFGFMASTGQSPAKRILNVYVIDTETGKAVRAGRMWVRDPLLKIIVIGNIIPFGGLLDGLFVLFDGNRQSLHDKVVSTVVVYAPQGLPEAMRNESMMSQSTDPTALTGNSVAGGSTSEGRSTINDVAERLRELARLREEGVITAEEYEQKRSELAQKL